MLFSVVVLLVLILVSGLLASSEIALSSSNRNKVMMQAESGNKKAAKLLATIDEPHSFFATTQLYITFIAFFSGAYAANSFTDPLVNWSLGIGIPLSANVVEPLMFVLITAVLTYVSLIIGELVPKRIAMQYSIPYILTTLPILNVLSFLALPIIKLLSVSAKLVLRLIGFKDEKPKEGVTKEEICMMMEYGSEHSDIGESEQDMVANVFGFDKLTAGDICTHRLDVCALPLDADFKTVADLWASEGYTRIPVYEENLDNICGILQIKDVLHFMITNPDFVDFDMKALLREVYFVPLSKKAGELFQEMREEHVFMAVVLDEYGGTMGVVTMEDLVEKIVGSIQDEYDNEQPDIIAVGKDAFKIQGTASLEAVQTHFEVTLPIEEYDTLSGFLVGQLGYIPAENEKLEVIFGGLLFKIERIQKKRVKTAHVTRVPIEDEPVQIL